jgi:hypothetical protein
VKRFREVIEKQGRNKLRKDDARKAAQDALKVSVKKKLGLLGWTAGVERASCGCGVTKGHNSGY